MASARIYGLKAARKDAGYSPIAISEMLPHLRILKRTSIGTTLVGCAQEVL
jgi:hypothetical protein